MYDPTDLQGQQRTREEMEARKRLDQEVAEQDLRWLMSSKRGRRIAWRLLGQAGVFRISFNTNAMQMAFNEGNRNYGNWFLEQVNTLCPELYPVMCKEQRNGNRDGGGNHSN